MDWSSPVVGWVGALGTSGAFLIAATVYADALKDRRRAQASVITGWIQAGEGYDRELHLSNGSNEPVFNLVVCPAEGLGEAQPLMPRLLPPSEALVVDAAESVGGAGHMLPAPVNILFTDASGRTWIRWGTAHRLTRYRKWKRWLGVGSHRWLPFRDAALVHRLPKSSARRGRPVKWFRASDR